MEEDVNVLYATKIPGTRTESRQFRPRVIDGALAAWDRAALLAVAAHLAGYDSMIAEVAGQGSSPSIWDDLDMTFACR